MEIAIVHLPWAAYEKVSGPGRGAAGRPDAQAILPPFWNLSYGEKKVDQWASGCQKRVSVTSHWTLTLAWL